MSENKKEDVGGGSTAGNTVGFQIPMGIKTRKAKIDELIKQHPDVKHGHVISFAMSLKDDMKKCQEIEKHLDSDNFDAVAEEIKSHMMREVVKNRVKEVVRKKAGGGGYLLYAPNPKKKGKPKPVGQFPTKLGAKRAELARFPPKDTSKLARLRKSVDKLSKDPSKAADKEKQARKEKGTAKDEPAKKTKKEGLELLRATLSKIISESLFSEERTGSEWDDYVSRLSKQAVLADKSFQSHQKNIEKKTNAALLDAFKTIASAVDKKVVKLKNFGVKKHDSGKTYLTFTATVGEVSIEPIYIYVENGIPKIEMSASAKAALTKAEPDDAKLFRAELMTVQERVLDDVDVLTKAIEGRDKYLTKLEDEVDSMVTDMSPLQISLLKQVLSKKYRKIS